MKKAKKYSEEYKREAVRLMQNRGDRTVVEIAASLGVRTGQLHAWRAALEKKGKVPSEASKPSDVERENERLRRRVRELEMEREILKKAAAFFAKEGM